MHVKDIILAILVAYVVLDICSSIVLKRKRPLVFKHLMAVMKKEKKQIFICFIIAIAAGVGTYYLAQKY